jgi:ketosteroid isomerase-like protein
MKPKRRGGRLVLWVGLLLVEGAAAQSVPPLEQVVMTERAFAREALQRGVTQAFLNHMADSALMQYRGTLQRAKPVWQSFPDLRDSLCWRAEWAGVSQDGDLGYTHGPYHTVVNGQTTQAGHFVTVWQRQPAGHYQFVLDLGADSPAFPQRLPTQEIRSHVRTTPNRGLTEAFIRAHDQAFADGLVNPERTEASYRAVLSSEGVVYRTNQPKAAGWASVQTQLRATSPLRYRVAGGGIARSGDVAYAYGTFEATDSSPVAGVYARIWRHETGQGWRLLVEVVSQTTQ